MSRRKRFKAQEAVHWPELLLVFISVWCSSCTVAGIRISGLEVPAAAMSSSHATLACHYELQGDQLYAVKWYKDFVEFYRHQPATGSEDLKSAFPSAGINLDLSKSNATHVHLAKINPLSEGTYKCELSAEAPSYATVSAERQMKVYVLPNQEPFIVDNSLSNGARPTVSTFSGITSHEHPLATQLATTSTSQPIYQVNDLLNFTCHSGFARPAPSLVWLLNDQPLAEDGKLVTRLTSTKSQAQQPDSWSLTETRLTLSMHLQPGHLSPVAGGQLTGARQLGPRLNCLVRYGLQFSVESSVQLSGGRATIMRRQPTQKQPPSLLPAPASLRRQPDESRGSSGKVDQTASVYRWSAGQSRNRKSNFRTDSADSWQPNEESRAEGSLAGSLSRNNGARRELSRGQLRDQAEHIEALLRKAHSNELEPPLIEARLRSLSLEDESEEGSSSSTAATSEGPIMSPGELWEPTRGLSTGALPEARRLELGTESIDYELNDSVEFRCQPRVVPSEGSAYKRVRIEWLINNQKISSKRLNQFDGKHFRLENHANHRHRGWEVRRFHRHINSDDEPSALSQTSPSNEQMSQESARNNNSSRLDDSADQLIIEFTPSIYQLKELNLKCRTIVDQPLIEFISQIFIPVPVSRYIQVDNNNHRQQQQQNQNQRVRGQVFWVGNNRQMNDHSNHRSKAGAAQRNGHQSSDASSLSTDRLNWLVYRTTISISLTLVTIIHMAQVR